MIFMNFFEFFLSMSNVQINCSNFTVFIFQFNMSHTIHQLSFGEEYPGLVNPLDSLQQVDEKSKYTVFLFLGVGGG